MLKAVKFGGSSVADSASFRKVRKIIESDPGRRIVVVSAAGKRSPGDHKMTDLLYLCHAHLSYGFPYEDILAVLRERFTSIGSDLGLGYPVGEELSSYFAALTKDTSVDELVSRGEYFTARLMADYLGYTFVDAVECIFFDYDGRLQQEKTYDAIAQALKTHERIVIPGFYGAMPNGRVRVMSRGGSDITGALAAAAVNAGVYENWTDVSGILMADPKIVPDPRPIPRITYAELQELANMGASVLHEDAILPVKEKGIPLNIRNTNCPEDPGTCILERIEGEEPVEGRLITGISGRRNFSIITLTRRNVSTNAALRSALEVLDRFHTTAEHITLGLDSFALVVSASELGNTIYDVIADLRRTCEPDSIHVQDGIALVAAVGRNMTSRPGTSGRLFQALGEKGLNIRTIAQGADELSIIVGVENKDFETAIRVLYDGFTG